MDTPPPLAPAPADVPSDASAIRKKYLNDEASVQAIGSLYCLGAAFCVVAAIASLVSQRSGSLPGWVSALMLIAIAVAEFVVGRWLRALDRRGRVPATILSALGLLAFPIGTIINGYILYLIHSKKGQYVFTPEYKAVIAATPQIKYKISALTLVLVSILIVLVVVGLVAAVTLKKH